MIRMLLDDARDWFPTTDELYNAMTQAQMKVVERAYREGDERALRLLYREASPLLASGEVICQELIALRRVVLYPRACRLYEDEQIEDCAGVVANYVSPDVYFNYTYPDFAINSVFPRDAVYTVIGRWNYLGNNYYDQIIYFNGDADARARFVFIVKPDPISVLASNYQLPEEYHPMINTLAAELLNDMDVGEMERGDATYQNQKLTLEAIGG